MFTLIMRYAKFVYFKKGRLSFSLSFSFIKNCLIEKTTTLKKRLLLFYPKIKGFKKEKGFCD